MDILINSQIIVDASGSDMTLDNESGLLTIIRIIHKDKYIPMYRIKELPIKLKDLVLIVYSGATYIRLVEPLIIKINGRVKEGD